MEICTDPVTSRRRSCLSCSIFGSLPSNTIESQLRTLYSHFFALILAVLSDSERETTAPQTQIPLTEKATAAGNPFPGGAQLATEEKNGRRRRWRRRCARASHVRRAILPAVGARAMSRSRAEDFSYSDLGCLNGIYTNIMNKNVMLTATTLLENNAILQIKLHSIC